jgi:predicted ATPase/DNA-binding SARP family transcriptional activator
MSAPENPPVPFTLTLFGPMQVLVEGRSLPRMRSRKGLWLLALLTLRHDRPVEREWLTGTLWPDMDQSQAFANLRPILSELRNGMGSQKERLQSPDRHTLLLDLSGAQVDLLAFDAAITSKKSTALEQAAALYQGPLLEGCDEEWVFQERNAREQSCLQALQQLGDTALATGDHATAIDHFQRAVHLDPWWEAARRGEMEARARSGDTNAALRVYREFIEVLKGDPHAAPDEQTTALYRRLRAEARQRGGSHAEVGTEPVVVPKVTGYLPHALTDLVGRKDERLEVALRLRRSRLVTLTGMGGIGKTRLALEVAREVSAEYPDGVWLVALEALSEGKQVFPQIASVLGLKEERGCTLQDQVTQHLHTKRLLLVLDNCEHVREASAQAVGHLLRECRQIRILATSREALDITGEMVWGVPSLATPDPAHLPNGQATLLRVLMGYESVQLFVERAQAVQKTFLLNRNNARAVAEACFRLEGIPLAIELAAARVNVLAVEQIAARLDNYLIVLTGRSRTVQAHQQTLRATLDWSYALLSDPERALLCRLSVFVGGWTLDAAEQVCVGHGIEAGQVLDLLTALAEKSLIVSEEREGEVDRRYHLLEMVRQYAEEALKATGMSEPFRINHRRWLVALAEEADPQLNSAEQVQAQPEKDVHLWC